MKTLIVLLFSIVCLNAHGWSDEVIDLSSNYAHTDHACPLCRCNSHVRAALGKGQRNQYAVIASGSILVDLFYDRLGGRLDALDRQMASRVLYTMLEKAPIGETGKWLNPNTGNYGFVTTASTVLIGTPEYSQPCREFTMVISVPFEGEGYHPERRIRQRVTSQIAEPGLQDQRNQLMTTVWLPNCLNLGGRVEYEAYGTACRQVDSSWKIVH